ncbi:MAG TPA: amino acid adenylation domain-containing protein, partial [Chloroflexota bacterium]|nr:amino acid adenylation domain-containing protein [Chloroflexota bacterium]
IYPQLLPDTLTTALKLLSRQERVTLFMLLLAAFEVMLYRYTYQDDLIVATAISDRARLETEGLIGPFSNNLLLRTDLSGNPTFRALLGRVRSVATAAFAHQDLPFEKLVEELQPARNLSHNPLFQVMFILHNAPLESVVLPTLTVRTLPVEYGTAKFDLTLSAAETAQGLLGQWEYRTDLFEEATIRRMAGHFQTLLEGIVADPERRLLDVPLLTAAERHQVVTEWNQTDAEYPRVALHRLFEAQVARTPQATAVVFGEQTLSYRELNCRANRLARRLRERGVGPETLVGLCAERSLDLVVGTLGILKAGGAYVPLDPTYPTERLAFMLEDARVPLLLVQPPLLDRCLGSSGKRADDELPAPPRPEVISLEEPSEGAGENLPGGAGPDNLAYVIYTSGSTGRPKGVLVEHGAVCNMVLAQIEAFAIRPESRVLQFAAFGFDASVSEIFTALCAGATLCLAPREALLPGPPLLRVLREQAIGVVTLPPSALATLPVAALPALGTLVSAGEACDPAVAARWSRGRRFLNAYGPTEATVCATIATYMDGSARTPIGRPIANVRTYLLDPARQPVPVGVPGELYIGGAGVARGYLNRPELTAERFLLDPFADLPGARMYRTGDLGRRLPDGAIEFMGRADDQVKIRGFRVELGEIEAVLRRHHAVREVTVVAREDRPGERTLVAYVVPGEMRLPLANRTAEQAGMQPVARELIADLRRFLQGYVPSAMVPASFMIVPALPLTPHGKVDRRALPAPDAAPIDEHEFVAPRDALERDLAAIWESLLDVRPVGVTADFFQIGGHSLLTARLLEAIARQCGQRLPLTVLFQATTVEAQARVLRQGEEALRWSPLVAIQPRGTRPPFFCVHPLLGVVFPYYDLARRLGADQPFYGLQAAGFDGTRQPVRRIENMATHYIEAIRLVQPEGPYQIGGWSLGSLIALEMARQLQAAGEEVALLAVVDTPAPSARSRLSLVSAVAVLLLLLPFVVRYIWPYVLDYLYLVLDGGGRGARLRAALFQRVRRRAGIATLAPQDSRLRRYRQPPLGGFLRIMTANLRATSAYRPHPYTGRIAVFGTRATLAAHRHDPTLGWSKMATGGVDLRRVGGNHMTVLRDPHVATLAGQLERCLSDRDEPS